MVEETPWSACISIQWYILPVELILTGGGGHLLVMMVHLGRVLPDRIFIFSDSFEEAPWGGLLA